MSRREPGLTCRPPGHLRTNNFNKDMSRWPVETEAEVSAPRSSASFIWLCCPFNVTGDPLGAVFNQSPRRMRGREPRTSSDALYLRFIVSG